MIVIGVPPAYGPVFGTIEVICCRTYVNGVGASVVPAFVVTATDASPDGPGGVVARTSVGVSTFRFVHATPPTLTLLVVERPVPVIEMTVPPCVPL